MTRPLPLAGTLLLVAALLHLGVLPLGGGALLAPVVVKSALLALLGLALRWNRRWVAYFAFPAILAAAIAALGAAVGAVALVSLTYGVVCALTTLAGIAVFLAIWRDAPARAESPGRG